MLTVLITLAALGFVSAIGGGIWWIVGSGKVTTRSGPEVGSEIMSELGGDDDEDGATVELLSASKEVFRGTGVKTEGSAEISFEELKQQLQAGGFRSNLPVLVAMVGLLSAVLFGSLALFVGLNDKLVGGIVLAVVLYTVGRMAYNFIRS